MGGSYNKKPKTILNGKNNYSLWVPAMNTELRAQECFHAVDKDIANPGKLTDAQKVQEVMIWLSMSRSDTRGSVRPQGLLRRGKRGGNARVVRDRNYTYQVSQFQELRC